MNCINENVVLRGSDENSSLAVGGHVLYATRIDRAKKEKRQKGEESGVFAPISEIDT